MFIIHSQICIHLLTCDVLVSQCSVDEGDRFATVRASAYAEGICAVSFNYAVLSTPVNCICIIRIGINILEGSCLGSCLALGISEQEGNCLLAVYCSVRCERCISYAVCDSVLSSPGNCLLELC